MFSENPIMSFSHRNRWFFPQQSNCQVNFTTVIWFQFVHTFFLQWKKKQKRKNDHFSFQTYDWHIYCIIANYSFGFRCYTLAQKWWISLLFTCFEVNAASVPFYPAKNCAKFFFQYVWIYILPTFNVYIWTCIYMHSNWNIRLIQYKMYNGMEWKINYVFTKCCCIHKVLHCMLLTNEY